MSNGPSIVERAEQPYVGIRSTVTMDGISKIADRLPEIFGWLAARGIAPVDAPFFKYNVIDMAGQGEYDLEVGVPVAAATTGEGDIGAGVLPAGRYGSLSHVGHPDELFDRTTELLEWAKAQGLEWDEHDDHWGCRLEIYKTDPREEPDMSKWETELAFRLAD